MPFVHTLDPVAFHIGTLPIRWYGLLFGASFLFIYYWLWREARARRFRMPEAHVGRLVAVTTIGILACARLFEVLVYAPAYYLANPWKVFALWEGGTAFHGALIGAVLAAGWYARRKGVPLLHVADASIVPISIAGVLVRLGNFINGELPGKVTALSWGVQFPGVGGFRHPTQLYDAAYNLLLFGVLALLWRKRLPEGRVFGWFFVLYAVLRFLVEFLKDGSASLGPFTFAQVFSLPMAAVGIWLLLRKPSARRAEVSSERRKK
jgi:phosphatidylglycerol:prolipoprotein diacylglycerol transferase